MAWHSPQGTGPGGGIEPGLLETSTTSKERMRKVPHAGFELQEAPREDEAEQCRFVRELQDKASSLSWSNSLMTPFGHCTCDAALVSASRISLHPPFQQHPGSVFVCSLDNSSPLKTKIGMTVPGTPLLKSGCTDYKISFFVPLDTRTPHHSPLTLLWRRAEGSSYFSHVSGTGRGGKWRHGALYSSAALSQREASV